jgi:hypothetical protein
VGTYLKFRLLTHFSLGIRSAPVLFWRPHPRRARFTRYCKHFLQYLTTYCSLHRVTCSIELP